MRLIATLSVLAFAIAPAPAQTPSQDIERYCTAMRDHVLEARYGRLERRATEARALIATERDALISRTKELSAWIERRERFLALADAQLVAIYGAMRPDTAGEQLALLSPTVAAAVLVRLKPRQSSAILAGMSAEEAAGLVAIIAASREPDDGGGGQGERRERKDAIVSRSALVPTVLAALSLAGCGTLHEVGVAPVPSPVEAPITLAAAPVPVAAHPPRPLEGSLWSSATRPLHVGARARGKGDLVTVIVAIDDEGSFRNTTDRKRTNSSGRNAGFSMLMPGGGAPGANGDMTFGGRTNHSGSGRTQRGERLSLRVAAYVEGVTPNGDLLVHGSQEVLLNQELRRLELAGVVRPRDIRPDNTVFYDRMAGARIVYGGRGRLTEVQQPSWGQQVMDRVSPL